MSAISIPLLSQHHSAADSAAAVALWASRRRLRSWNELNAIELDRQRQRQRQRQQRQLACQIVSTQRVAASFFRFAACCRFFTCAADLLLGNSNNADDDNKCLALQSAPISRAALATTTQPLADWVQAISKQPLAFIIIIIMIIFLACRTCCLSERETRASTTTAATIIDLEVFSWPS